MLAIFSRTGMFYPSAAELALTSNCKCTLKIPGTRIEMFINTNNWKEHFTACFSVSTRQGHWVAFRSGGGPPRHILAVWLNPVWVSLYPPCLHCSPSGTWLSVPPSRQPSPPGDFEGELDVGPDKRNIWSSWGCVRICSPAGGQARLCPTEAACGSVS